MQLIKVKDGVASREPLPDFLIGLLPESLINFDWLDPSYGLQGCGWWPEEATAPPLGQYQSYGQETLTPDPVRYVVVSAKTVVDWTPEEILAYKASITRRVSRLAFRNRFTPAEKVAFELAQPHDPADSLEARQLSAQFRVLEKDLNAGQFVDLNSALVQAGVAFLAANGVIAAGRSDEILWADILGSELP